MIAKALWGWAGGLATSLVLMLGNGWAAAQTAPRIENLETGTPVALERLRVGSQGMIGLVEQARFRVAGYEVTGGPGRALAGQAADTIYLAVTSGSLTIQGQTAGAGRIILIEPLKRGHQIQRFDAARLLASLSKDARVSHPKLTADLKAIAARQRIAIFFGRYETTRFNAHNPGSVKAEELRRKIVGSDTIRSIRFGGVKDPAEVERLVVQEFINALIAGDAAKVAELLDPTPYGGRDLRGGDAARRFAAADLIASRNWRKTITGPPAFDAGKKTWRVSGRPGVVIRLRPVTDFVFVRSVN